MRRIPALLVSLALILSMAPSIALAMPPAGGARQAVVVVFHDSVTNPADAASQLGGRHGFAPVFVYQHALKGFAASVPTGALEALGGDPRIASIEADQAVRLDAQATPTGISRIFATSNAGIDIDGTDDYRVDVDVAIIDTGIDLDHPDLNVVASTNCTGGGPFGGSCGSGGDDDNSHGTHVAGTVGALDNGQGVVGVAPGARLHAVKVLRADGSGYISWIVAGIDWVTARASTIEVANMSLGCACSSSAMNSAIARSVDAGVAYAVAAGNSDADAKSYSPANHPDVLTVSALADFDGIAGGLGTPTCRTDEDDTLANFSNFGAVVEIAAPGVCILSSVPGGGYDTFSGTSMASPHAAGALALVASGTGDPTSQAQVEALYNKLVVNGNLNWTDDSGDGIKEPLLDVSNTTIFSPTLVATDGGGGGGANSPPVANDDAYSTGQDTTLSVAAPGVLGNDTDADNDPLTATLVGGVSSGSLTLNSDGSFSYAPNSGFTGTDSFTYKASDGTVTSDAATVTITVTAASSTGIVLEVRAYKVKGLQKADLKWSGAGSTQVDVYRGTSIISTTSNDGAYTDNIDNRGGGSYTYKVCEAGTSTCSNEVTASY